MLERPAHVTGEAAAEWDRLLAANPALTEAQRPLLELYAVVYSRWRSAETQLAELGPVVKSPTGFPVANPFLTVADRCIRQLGQLAAQIGIAKPRGRNQPQPQAARSGGEKKPALKIAPAAFEPAEDPVVAAMLKQLQGA